MIRILLSTILIVTIMIGYTGCVFDNKPKQDVNELALDYMEQKYGENFEYSAPAGASYTGTRTFLAKCESFGDKNIVVQIENFKDEEKRVFKDNYFEVKYADQLNDYLSQIVNDQFDEYKMYYFPLGTSLSADLPADATFDDYLKDSSGDINALAVVKKSVYKDRNQLSEIMETISSNCAAETISIIVLVIEDSKYSDCSYSIAKDYNIRDNYFAKGRILRGCGITKIDYYGGE